jgi:hypothetical protein
MTRVCLNQDKGDKEDKLDSQIMLISPLSCNHVNPDSDNSRIISRENLLSDRKEFEDFQLQRTFPLLLSFFLRKIK